MAYLFLSQHHKTNAGEWSCETYCSEDYPLRQLTLEILTLMQPMHIPWLK